MLNSCSFLLGFFHKVIFLEMVILKYNTFDISQCLRLFISLFVIFTFLHTASRSYLSLFQMSHSLGDLKCNCNQLPIIQLTADVMMFVLFHWRILGPQEIFQALTTDQFSDNKNISWREYSKRLKVDTDRLGW